MSQREMIKQIIIIGRKIKTKGYLILCKIKKILLGADRMVLNWEKSGSSLVAINLLEHSLYKKKEGDSGRFRKTLSLLRIMKSEKPHYSENM